MDKDLYASLQEAYQLVQEQGNTKRTTVDVGAALKNVFGSKAKNSGDRRSAAAAQRRGNAPQTTKAETPTSTPASTPAPRAASPSPAPAAKPDPKPTPAAAKPDPKPTPAATPAPKPTPKPESRAPKPGFRADGRSLNTPAADRARKVKAAGGDPTAGGEFKTKVTDTGSARLNKALSGIGKWKEETILQYAQDLVEGNYADTVENALVIIQHLSPEVLDEALS
jgi:outer membrane biosynthesis protein TonB